MFQYTLKHIEGETGLKYDYLRKAMKYLGEAFIDHAQKAHGKGWHFDQQGVDLYREIASLKDAGLDLPQIKSELARLGYFHISETSKVSDEESFSPGPSNSPSEAKPPKTGEAFVIELLSKVEAANEKMEELRDEQFKKEKRILKYQKRRERLLAQMEHMGFWSVLFKRKGMVAKLRKIDEDEAKRLRPIHIHDKEGLNQALEESGSWVED